MPSWMPATGPERFMWLAIIILVVGYLAGQWLNRQRSKRIGSWLQAGLGALGGRVTWKWLKSISAGAEITVQETRAPFRNLVIGYYLLTREFAPLWLLEVLRGKRDLLSVRADLKTQPSREFEILPLAGRLRKDLDSTAGQPLDWRELGQGLGLATRGKPDPALLNRLAGFLRTYGPSVERVSLRQRTPHVIAFLRLQGLERTESKDLWRALGELVR